MFAETFRTTAQALDANSAFHIAREHSFNTSGVISATGGLTEKQDFILFPLPDKFKDRKDDFLSELTHYVRTTQPFREIFEDVESPAVAFEINAWTMPKTRTSKRVTIVATEVQQPVQFKTAYRVREIESPALDVDHPECRRWFNKDTAFEHAKKWTVQTGKKHVVEIVGELISQEPTVFTAIPNIESTDEFLTMHTYVFMGTSEV